jgi:hypothetical protein
MLFFKVVVVQLASQCVGLRAPSRLMVLGVFIRSAALAITISAPFAHGYYF